MDKILNYIGGEYMPAASGNFLENLDPAEGAGYSLLPDSGPADVDRAVDAASGAFGDWAAMPVERRSALLMKLADLLEKDLEHFARAESIDSGKPLTLARRLDIPRAVANLRFYATAALHFSDAAHLTDSQAVNYTSRAPVGVAGCISPWNLPLYLFTWKIAPALASGCTVVAKPSELAPMTAFLFSQLCTQAGLPKGVLNIVHGLGEKAGQPIVAHPDVPALSFTGGTATGKKIATIAAPMFKKLSLELGGKNPNIIFADCDLQRALDSTIKSSFSNQGEICLCGSRVLVERSLYDRFLEELARRTAALVVGDPLREETDLGALISKAHMNKVLGYIDLAKQEGGTIITGGRPARPGGRCERGFFVEPTIIAGLGPQCRTNQEEIFGPVITVSPFDDEEEAIALANGTAYGLAATVWTENLTRAHRVSARIKSGIVWVNCWLLRDLRTPFGGMKQSGVGREGGWEGLRFFTESRNICIRIG